LKSLFFNHSAVLSYIVLYLFITCFCNPFHHFSTTVF
jgi:hypothetical protein